MPDTVAAGRAGAVWETPSTTVATHTIDAGTITAAFVQYADTTQVRYADNTAVEYAA